MSPLLVDAWLASRKHKRPTTQRAGDVPDLAGGFWGPAESRDAEPRRPSGSPESAIPLRHRG